MVVREEDFEYMSDRIIVKLEKAYHHTVAPLYGTLLTLHMQGARSAFSC